MAGGDETSSPERAGGFATTHWNVVLAAKAEGGPHATAALEKLCCDYWPPLYAFIRREGHSAADAQDLTQAFFGRLLERAFLDHLHHQRGKFRSFLLIFLKHFLADQRDRAAALKRGGGQAFISLDEFATEAELGLAAADALTPDQAFERRWASTVFERAVRRLRSEYTAAGKADLFEVLKDLPAGAHGADSYRELGARLGLTEGGVKSAVHRLRRRHAMILRDEIAQTVARPEEINEEIQNLLAVFSR